MTAPVLHLVAGPNGCGKSTFVEHVLAPSTALPFINADIIAARTWPGDEVRHAYDASRLATQEREAAMARRSSLITETVFSHPSKIELIRRARDNGYLTTLHVVMLPVETAVRRVAYRVAHGGHDVPEQKIHARYARLWELVARARTTANRTVFYDNSLAARPFRIVARFRNGSPIGAPTWPVWTPDELRS